MIHRTLFIFTLLFLNSTAQNQNNNSINVSLSTYNESVYTTQVFNATTTLQPEENLEITVTNVDRLIKFFVIQAHSFQLETALSYYSNFSNTKTVNGTNIGLVQTTSDLTSYKFYIRNVDKRYNSTVFLVVIPYLDNVPIPGGCNMEFNVETAPYLRLKYNDDIITVDAASASYSIENIEFICETYLVDYKMYHRYLPERDYSKETYFDELKKMLTVEDIVKNGKEIHKHIPSQNLRSLYSAYRGTGAIFAVIATFGDDSSAYVPITTYACDALNWEGNCDGPYTPFSRFLCGSVLFLGLFTCFFGHRFFKTTMFLVGAFIGSYLSYIGFYYTYLFDDKDLMITAVSLGVIIGFIWLMFWWFCGIPIVSILFTILLLGLLFGSVIFYIGLGDINIFESDLNYWGILICITLLNVIVLIGFTYKANIAACSILGAYATILPIDHYIGSNLKYILINVVRRATVKKFEYAVLDPPYQKKDVILVVVWTLLTIFGIAYQMRQQKGRPPFPPPPFHTNRMQQLNERTPLLVHQQNVTSQPNNTEPLIQPTAPNYRLIA